MIEESFVMCESCLGEDPCGASGSRAGIAHDNAESYSVHCYCFWMHDTACCKCGYHPPNEDDDEQMEKLGL